MGKQKKDFAKPVFAVHVKGSKTYTLSIYAKTDKDAEKYPAVSSENEYPFILPQWQTDNIMKKPEELLVKEEKK